MEWVETTGKTLDEAKEQALDRLGHRSGGRRVRGARGAADRALRSHAG